MTLPRFEYLAPTSVEEASSLLMEKGEDACIVAGGTDLLIKMRHGQLRPSAVIGLKRIKGLDCISFSKKQGLVIGATALLADVASHPDILKKYPAVAYAASKTANVQIRNMGTVAGNLCNAAPSAENAPVLIAMGAEVTLLGREGERRLLLDRFFRGPGLTALYPGEILTSIRVPLPPPKSGTSYHHISARGKVDISAVGVGVLATMEGKTCKHAVIVMGAVAATPIHASNAERLIRGKELTPGLMKEAGILASREARPISDVRASADYRRKMVAVLTKRALAEAGKMAQGR